MYLLSSLFFEQGVHVRVANLCTLHMLKTYDNSLSVDYCSSNKRKFFFGAQCILKQDRANSADTSENVVICVQVEV